MIFNSFAYFVLFLLPGAWVFRRASPRWKPVVLALTGAAFYVYFSLVAFGGAAGALCLGIFLWEALVSRLYRPGSHWCWFGIAQALAVLFVFKYWNFAVSILPGDGQPFRWADAFLPLGISFFTFEFIHYAADRRQGKTEGGSLWEYLAFILFFPTMVAGPIKRYQDFLTALRLPSTDAARDFERGVTRILVGLAKKFAIADVMTAFTAHLNMADIAQAQRWALPLWLLAYGVQIYVDFSAYSDIAIGSARLFGLKVKENFDWPYLRTNIAEFWRHWHMSLTRWLTDYVFVPLGGSRVASGRIYLNVLATLLVSGLWHGAGWNFVIWGLWHGVALIIHRWWAARRVTDQPGLVGQIGSWLLTFITVNLGWAWFAMDHRTAFAFFRRLLFLD